MSALVDLSILWNTPLEHRDLGSVYGILTVPIVPTEHRVTTWPQPLVRVSRSVETSRDCEGAAISDFHQDSLERVRAEVSGVEPRERRHLLDDLFPVAGGPRKGGQGPAEQRHQSNKLWALSEGWGPC